MPLHAVRRSNDPETDDANATDSSAHRVQKYHLPEHTSSAHAVYSPVHDEPVQDGNSRLNIAIRAVVAGPAVFTRSISQSCCRSLER